MTAQCRVVVRTVDDVLALPNAALKWEGDKQVVYVKGGLGGVETVEPELGLAGLDSVEVLSGLEAGDEVAIKVTLPEDKDSAGKDK